MFCPTELRALPVLPLYSPLKILNAPSCSIKTIHPSYLRLGIFLNLDNNQIAELPREATIDYLMNGGKLSRSNGSIYNKNRLQHLCIPLP